ncbi:Schlafen-like protein 1 [Mizuhopecten yessoensis]|uniref:Schlafen-like protein 1 n=2 Tax=Mizuhopecten yessoensis TaxID=6573 RepID=A0A210QQE9_MIZYE|nr:Schlafen-like protein 1 [Mizuhopecten yessoensis]
MSERALSSRLLQYHMDLTRVKDSSSIHLASLTVIQEFLKNDKNGNIRQMFLDNGLVDSVLVTIDSALDDQSELASLDVALKCLWFLSQLSIGPLQNMISGDVMRRLLYLLDVKGSIYHFTSEFSRAFQQLCENRHLVGKIQTKQMSAELHYEVHKLSNRKLKYLDMLPDNLNTCSLFDTSDSDMDVNITDHLLENFKQYSWPNRADIQEKKEDEKEWKDIFVSEVIDGPLFWAHIGMSNIETVRDIQMALATENLRPTKCIAGDIVVVKKVLDSDDLSIYIRARVIKVDQWKVKVWALDYGYEMELPHDQVYAIPDHIGTNKYPPQISLCRLAGVEAPPRHQVIPQLAASILCNICHKSIPACEILAQHGGLEILEKFIRHCPDPGTIIPVLTLITIISFHCKMSSSISCSNLTECILDNMSKFKDYPPNTQEELLVASLNGLCNVLFKNDTTREKFYHHEGINIVMRIILQHANVKDRIYHAGTHLLRIFVRKIDTEQSTVVQRRRSLDRQRRKKACRPPSGDKKHLDPMLKKCPNEFAKLMQSSKIGVGNKGTTKSRLYETAWSDESDEENDSFLVTRMREDPEGSIRPVTTCDAAHYYGQSTDKTLILGSEVEFENDSTHELRPNKSIFKVSSAIIAKHVCGFLNSGKGGSIYFGIRSTIQGVELKRNDRDEFRLSVDRMMCDKVSPCVLHSMFDVIYTPVMERDENTDTLVPIKDHFVAEIIVKTVSNSIMHTVKGGECFYRFGAHTSQLSAQEMRQLIIFEEEELFMEEIKQLSLELEHLKS